MRRRYGYYTDRITPDAVRDYRLDPAANVVDKQSRYNPRLEDSTKLRNTAQGLSDLARGLTDVNILASRQAYENVIEAQAKTKDENKAKWAEVSKNVKGMAIFNPYNKEAFRNLRAKELAEEGVLKLRELETNCASLTPEEFDTQRKSIQEGVINSMKSEGLKAKYTADYLIRFQHEEERLKQRYVTENAKHNYNKLQNQIITSTSKDFATLTSTNPEGFLEGWKQAITNLETTANGLGMNNEKQYELLTGALNQYLIDNVDDIDPEQFILAVGTTKLNNQSLSDFDPNYTETIRQLLIKAKRTKYDNDSLDLQIEKLRLEQATLNANAEMFKLMADPNTTDLEILNKANELIEEGGMQSIGFNFLQSVVNDKNTLITMRTASTNPETNAALMQKYITGDLTQSDIVEAFQNKKLSPRDASSFFNALQSNANESYSEQLKALNELYLGNNPVIDIGDKNKKDLTKTIYETISDPNLSKAEKAEAFNRIKGVAEYMDSVNQLNKSKDPSKLLRSDYMATQKVADQSTQEAQRYLAQLGLFRNQLGGIDKNIKVTSAMQTSRTVTLADGTVKTARHTGTDVTTSLGRQIVAPRSGKVVASGYEKTMGNYLLFECDGGGYIKLLHLQSANLPKVGTRLIEGLPLAYVGNSGHVTSKNMGILHVECFDKRMRLVDPKQFIKGK